MSVPSANTAHARTSGADACSIPSSIPTAPWVMAMADSSRMPSHSVPMHRQIHLSRSGDPSAAACGEGSRHVGVMTSDLSAWYNGVMTP